jgi:hypothetical protein
VPGQRQEHVIERWPPEGDVVDMDVGIPEVADDLHQGLGPADRLDRQLAGVLVELRLAGPVARQDRPGSLDLRPVVDHHLDPVVADLGLQLVGRPTRDDPTVVDDGDGVGQLVGLLQVLGRQQERRPLAHE